MSEIGTIIIEELKVVGLEVGEESAKAAVRAVFKSIPRIVLATENKVDDLLVPLLGIIEPEIIKLLDKIDGEEG